MSCCTRPVGTYLLLLKYGREDRRARMEVGQVVGYDLHGSKYKYRQRTDGWGAYYWPVEDGWWAFEQEVLAELTEEQAQAQLVGKDDGRILLFEIDWKPGGTGGGKVWELVDDELVARETHASYQAACDAYGERGWRDYL